MCPSALLARWPARFDDGMWHDTALTERRCWELLASTDVARLAVDIAGQPDIFPINYAVDRRSLVFRTRAGTKLAGAVVSRYVALEIDGVDPMTRTAWSVVVKGTAREVSHPAERDAVERLPLVPWVSEITPEFVRIEPELVTGREFRVTAGIDLSAARST